MGVGARDGGVAERSTDGNVSAAKADVRTKVER
jgi:hypothetical protein